MLALRDFRLESKETHENNRIEDYRKVAYERKRVDETVANTTVCTVRVWGGDVVEFRLPSRCTVGELHKTVAEHLGLDKRQFSLVQGREDGSTVAFCKSMEVKTVVASPGNNGAFDVSLNKMVPVGATAAAAGAITAKATAHKTAAQHAVDPTATEQRPFASPASFDFDLDDAQLGQSFMTKRKALKRNAAFSLEDAMMGDGDGDHGKAAKDEAEEDNERISEMLQRPVDNESHENKGKGERLRPTTFGSFKTMVKRTEKEEQQSKGQQKIKLCGDVGRRRCSVSR